MDRAMTLQFLLTLMLLVLYPETEGQWVPHPPVNPPPLCASQFALVNRACSMLPYTPVPPPSPPAPPSPTPPIPSALDGPEDRHGHRHGHGHSHSHRHGHGHRRHGAKETSAEADCCRWVKQVDNVCVCELLVHLPLFLTRPVHNYTVVVDEACEVTFQCGSRLVRV